MRYLKLLLTLFVLVQWALVVQAVDVPKYGVFEVTLTASGSYSNPYLQMPSDDSSPGFVVGTFNGPGGAQIVIDGFWDGGTSWKIRMAPTVVGAWTYSTSSSDSGLNAKTGSFTCTTSSSKGFPKVDPSHTHHFAYDDGTPFYWAPVTTQISHFDTRDSEGDNRRADDGTFQALGNMRAAQGFTTTHWGYYGFNKGQFNAHTQANEGGPPFTNYDPDLLNPAYYQYGDLRVQALQASGIISQFNLGWPDQSIESNIGHPRMKRYWRYLIARNAAYNVNWNLFGEINEFGSDWLTHADEYGNLTRNHDPYHHMLSTHTSGDPPADFCNRSWLDYIMLQRGTTVTQNWLGYNKPVINSEYMGYEDFQVTGEQLRPLVWDVRMRGGYFVYESWGNEINSVGATYSKWCNLFFSTRTHYWLLEYHPELFSSRPGLANPGYEYCIYLSAGGSITVNLSSASGTLNVYWYNPRNGQVSSGGTTTGGASRSFSAPDSNDWTLHIKKSDETQAPSVPTNVTATALSPTMVQLSWTASTDNVGVTGYNIYRNGSYVSSSSGTSTVDVGLQGNTTYSYKISAYDWAGNESAQSSPPATVTTPPLPDYCTVDMGSANISEYLSHVTNSDGDTTSASAGNLECRQPVNTGDQYFYFAIDDSFLYNEAGTTRYLEVCYYDDQTSSVYMQPQYDAVGDGVSNQYRSASSTYFTNTGKWKTATWTLTECKFANRQNAGADFRIYVGPYTVKIDSVRLSKVQWSSYNTVERDIGAIEIYRGISHPQPSDGDTVAATAGGRDCRRCSASGDNYMYFNVSDAIIYNGSPATVYLKVAYYDSSGGSIQPQYDSTGGTYTNATTLTFTGTNTWLEATWTLTNARFANNQSGSADLRLNVGTSQNVYIDKILVSKQPFTADTTPPSVPTGVTATAQSSTSIQVNWTASTDNVGVTGYKIYRNTSQVGTSATTSYTDTGLTPSTTYSYTVSAYDAANNNSAQSSPPATATTQAGDTQAPSVPTGVTATAQSGTSIQVSWTASTDNVGVTGYKIYRNTSQVGTSATTSYTDTGLTPGTTYSYTVSAYDAANNNSAQSSPPATATTQAGDTQAPSVPTNVTAAAQSSTSIQVAWTASTDNVGVTGYKVFRDGGQTGTTTNTSYLDTGLSPSTTYSYTVSAYDGANNNSAQSSPAATATTMAAGSVGQWLWVADNHSGSAGSYTSNWTDEVHYFTESRTSAGWYWSWDDPSVGYARLISPGTGTGRSWLESNSFGEEWSVDTGITIAAKVKPVTVSGQGDIMLSVNNSSTADINSPEDPGVQSTHVWVGWDAGEQVVFVTRNGTVIKQFTSSVTFTNTWCIWTLGGKQIGNTMAWDLWINGTLQDPTAQASDSTYHTLVWSKGTDEGTACLIGQRRPQSFAHDTIWDYVGVTKNGVIPGWDGISPTGGDTQSPSVPTNVQANAQSETAIQVTWTASTDNVGVTGYKVYRNGGQVGTTASTNYTDTGLTVNTTYSYTVSAYDAAANNSAQSSPPATATTPDQTAPSIPSNVSASAQSETSVQVTWTASTDNVGVTGYKIYRNGGQVGTSASASYTDTGLTASTTYSYTVSAYDAAANNSAQSSPAATVMTPGADTQAPGVPTDVTATTQTPTTIKVTWTASTDNVGVTGYKIFRNGSQVGTSATTSYTDTGLTPETEYTYKVSAYDAAGNNSSQSSPSEETTLADMKISDIKKLSDSSPAGLASVIVTSIVDDCFYAEEEDRFSGIRVVPIEMPSGLAVGQTVDVGGTMQTTSDDERYIYGYVKIH